MVTFGNALAVLAVSVHFSRGQDVAKQAILGSSHLHSGRRPCLSTVRESVWRNLFPLNSSLGRSLDVGEAVFVSMGLDGEKSGSCSCLETSGPAANGYPSLEVIRRPEPPSLAPCVSSGPEWE